jgi:hypothetical protein
MGAWCSKEKPKPVENTAMILIGDLGVCQKTYVSLLKAAYKSFAVYKDVFSLDKVPFNGCINRHGENTSKAL